MLVQNEEVVLKGLPISPGIAIGSPFFFTFVDEEASDSYSYTTDPDQELHRYHLALVQTRQEIKNLQKRLEKEGLQDAADILEAQQHILRDELFTVEVEHRIRKTRKNSVFIVHNILKEYKSRVRSIEDEKFRSRFQEIQDLGRRLLGHLKNSIRISLADIPPNSVVFAWELYASHTAEAKRANVSAFVTAQGGITSHAAIVSKAKQIPYVANVDFQFLKETKTEIVIVDGRKGEIILNPQAETLNKYRVLQKQLHEQLSFLTSKKYEKIETKDGVRVRIYANIEMLDEINLLQQYKHEGIGLFRSEYLFLSRKDYPALEEQIEVYKSLIKEMNGLRVTIRTFDLRGDKLSLSRGLFLKGKPLNKNRPMEAFRTQVKAVLYSSLSGEVQILLPMISSLNELREAKKNILEIKKEIEASIGKKLPRVGIGCMIEVPAAVMIIEHIAKECDFLSIGTNDLIQYSLAKDRDSVLGNDLSHSAHPGIIRFIKKIVAEGKNQVKNVYVCGEMAADPRFTALLIGLGIDTFSLSVPHIPIISNVISRTSFAESKTLAEQSLQLETGTEVMELLAKNYRKCFPDDSLYGH